MNKMQISEAVWTVVHFIRLEKKLESETIKLSVARWERAHIEGKLSLQHILYLTKIKGDVPKNGVDGD